MNNAFRARRLAGSEVIVHLGASEETKSRVSKLISDHFLCIEKINFLFRFFVLRTKTIIHLSVGESGGYSRIKRRHIERSLYFKRSVAKVRNFFLNFSIVFSHP